MAGASAAGLIAVYGAALDPFSIEWVDQGATVKSSSSDLTTYSFTGLSFGAEATGSNQRYIVLVAQAWRAGLVSVNSATMGDAGSVSRVANYELSASTDAGFAMFVGQPTGTSGDVSFTCSAGATLAGCAIYRMVNPTSTTPHAFGGASHSSGVVTLSRNIPAGGAAIGVVGTINASTSTWSGLTENEDYQIQAGEYFTSAVGGSAGTPHVITCTNADTTPEQMAGLSASWS